MIHYIYLGCFDHEGEFIRFEKRANTKPAWYRPVVARPLDWATIAELLEEKGLTPSTVPDDWGVAFEEEGFLSCDRHTRNRDARDFVERLASRTGCDIADYGSLSLVSPEDLWRTDFAGQAGQAKEKTSL